ncbi:helix-turn-helix transcriptional regulator [Pseudonocardia hydrocarbonoxydans]|uniref:DNA-binding response regulator n=1 Tax=Pseudonocardia hydrocarbonoxydans TaxID=76726 RepID=A0A4Y3WQB2_9PSEU|nr:LuxR C-terminal-related transcriptional regulator [Pseudonocardia hydrocarbonoxydans]GEC20471.1 DNA-binding response regulator [Pseudonocardia hydrocarbonoxydans]
MTIVSPPWTPRRVLVVHTDTALRRSVVHGLRGLGVGLVLEAASAREAGTVARSPGARDLAMVEVVDGEGWALVADLRRVGWAPVVALPAAVDVTLVSGALSRGASAALFPPGERAAPVPPGDGTPAVTDDPRPVPDVHGEPQLLSRRELQILQFAADGLANTDIARKLGISPLTVKSHLGRIARRLGSGERAQMVLLALRAGVIG